MVALSIVLPPVIGAVIGYVTNDIAIWMLFRPLKPIKVFGRKLPFTPGIIPKNRARIAKSIGNMVSSRLISKEVLVQNLLSTKIEDKIRQLVEQYLERQAVNEEPMSDYASKLIGQDSVSSLINKMVNAINAAVESKLSESKMGGWGMLAMSFMGVDIRTKIREIVVSFCQTPVSSLMSKAHDNKEVVVEKVLQLYRQVVSEHIPSMLDGLDVATIVEEKVNAMDLYEVESMIRDVINNELRAIVWFGALLGFMLGWVNVLVNYVMS